ncbi:hypothetical protein HLB23_29175 [Nocardia uniformis]|uniref:Uncharacterized protein n=1 Tax=Nocardia uniformis TaxID=53432 RepID=A0A849CBY5_9NOCA|nr:hypothetical protein [Nocardia uniformis]NNH73880.1 hypothetical protein [Nocardia uniformis]
MSQYVATRSATARKARRAAQILRHTAVVTAGMTSIGLTVAAGSYIANEMAAAQRPEAAIAAPPAPNQPTWNPGPGGSVDRVDIAPIAESIGLASIFAALPRESTVLVDEPSAGAADRQQPNSPGFTGNLRLGTTYLGAQVVPVLRNSVAVTLDTNVFGTVIDMVLPSGVAEQLDIGPAGTTRLHTEFDMKRGEVTLVVSDSALGRVGVQLARHPAPAATNAEEPVPERVESTPSPEAIDTAGTDRAVPSDTRELEHPGAPEPADLTAV